MPEFGSRFGSQPTRMRATRGERLWSRCTTAPNVHPGHLARSGSGQDAPGGQVGQPTNCRPHRGRRLTLTTNIGRQIARTTSPLHERPRTCEQAGSGSSRHLGSRVAGPNPVSPTTHTEASSHLISGVSSPPRDRPRPAQDRRRRPGGLSGLAVTAVRMFG